MWSHNTLPHALLITGAEGTGGLPLALAIAQYIFCEQKSPTDSCGVCAGCSKITRMEHADLHLSFPTISPKNSTTKATSKLYISEFREFVKQAPYGTTYEWLQHINAENKQGNITAEECNDIIGKLYLRAYEGGKKVLIMWRPEYLGKEGNKLLKVIEEPPQDTVMIFVAEDRNEILATIRSRTQEIRLVPIPHKDIADALVSRNELDARQAEQIALLAQGSYTEALSLLRHNENDLFPEAKRIFVALFTNNGPGMTSFVEDWAKAGREQQKNLLQYVIQLLEHMLRVQFVPQMKLAMPDTEAEFVRRLATRNMPIEAINKMTAIVNDTSYAIERNAHSKTQLLAMMVELHQIIRQLGQ